MNVLPEKQKCNFSAKNSERRHQNGKPQGSNSEEEKILEHLFKKQQQWREALIKICRWDALRYSWMDDSP